MSRIRVRIKGGHKAKVNIKNAQPVQVKTDTTYLYDPTIIDKEVQQAKDWAIKTDGLVEEEGVGIDYSAKAYAIGGTGTTTNNAKYYAEQAGISETNASNSATSASGSASSASSSASLAKDWATKTDGTVDGVDYSSKYYAQQITPIATDITTVAGIASDVTTVANNSSNITTVAGNTTNINKVAGDINRVNLVADDIDSVHTVAVDISTVIDVADNKTNIDAVAGNASNINAVAGNESNINAVASNETNINAVNANKTNIDTVAGISSDVTAVASNESNINAVADNETNINAVNANKTNIDAVAGNETNINSVANNESNINAVADNESNINAVNANKTNIDAVAGNATNINAVANNSTNINAVAGNATNINAVASDATNIDAVAGDLTNIDAVANDLTNIDNASTYANNAHIWAEGSDVQVAGLGGEKSSKGWAARAKELVDSIGSVLHYKGSVATRADLPASGQVLGDMYNITSDGSNVVWNGSNWDDISGVVDLSAYRTASDQDTIDAGKVPTTRTVNGKALSSNISLTHSDVGAVEANASITGATKCKITYDSKGLVTSGADLQASDIPSLTLSKISDVTASASELNILDGATLTTTELNYVDGVTSSIQTQLNGKQPTGNYVTLDTLQTLTSGKKIFANDVNMAGNQTALLATISNSNTYTTDNAWVGRYICGAKNLTFLMGTYRTMAGIGAHSWSNAQTGSGASWADFYLNPDGSNAVYIGGNLWTKNSGWMKIKNDGNANGTVQVNRNSIASPSWKNVACWDDNVSKFNNDAGYITGITYSDVITALGYTPYDSTNPSGYQANVIETVKVNGTALTPSSKAVDITVPTNNNQLTNGAGYITSSALTGYATETWVGQQGFLTSTALNGYATESWVGQQGYITGITSAMVTTALGYSPVNPTSLASVATSGSYNDLSNKPTIPAAQVNSDWNANSGVAQILNKPTLATVATTGAYSDLSGKPTIPTVNNPTITITQGGVTKGSITLNQSTDETIELDAGGGGGSVDIDGISITKNGDDELQTVGVIDQNNTSSAIKTWTGTKAQYDAIVSKDANTLYNITDDTNPTQALLEAIYPVGSVYIGTMSVCPLSALFGTWTLVSTKILTDIPNTLEAKGNGMALGLTNGTQNAGLAGIDAGNTNCLFPNSLKYGSNVGESINNNYTTRNLTYGITTDSTKSGIVADTNATSLTVNIWERVG